MAKQKSGYVTINEIVEGTLINLGESTFHKYQTFLHWALRGVKYLNYDTLKEVKTVFLKMNDSKAIDLPTDYVDFTKIGLIIGDRVKTFGINEKLAFPRIIDECGNPLANPLPDCNVLKDTDPSIGGYWFINYRNGQHQGRIFGFGGGHNGVGYYRVDKEKNQIMFSSEVNDTEILLEYITDGINPTEQTIIHKYAEETLIAWIHWQAVRYNSLIPQVEKMSKRQEFYNELRLTKARVFSFTLPDLLESTRRFYKLSTKT